MLGTIRIARSQGEPITVSVMGDVPYGSSEIPVLEQQMADHNLYSPSEYIFHVGDIKQQSEPCDEERFIIVADILKSVAVPAFIIPGDNEWTDCPNPQQAWSYWEAHLLGIEAYSCGTENVERQAVRPENFAFVEKGVLFMGINLVASKTPSSSEWDQIMQDDADWVVQKFQEYGSQVRAVVVTSQCGPGSSKHDLFFDEFEPAAGALGKPVLFIHGDGHSWIQDNPFSYSNMMRVQVEQGGNEDPVQLTVTMNTQNVNNTFEFLRNPWNNNPPLFNVPPCVKAGEDQIVSVLSGINLQGSVKDDGVPLSPGSPTVTWSKVSGPGTVTFGDDNDAVTTVSFGASGIYVLRLSADDGQMVSEDELIINVDAGSLEIYSFSPDSGSVGAEVTITGLHFSGTSEVAFNGVPASIFTVDSDTQVRAEVPAGATTGKISMTNPNSSGVSDDDFVVVNLPVITSFSPAQGPVLTEVEVIGAHLTAVTEVSFNGVLADSFFVDSDNLLRAYVPAGASSGLISLTNLAGTAFSSSIFTVTHIPVIVGFTPTIGTIGTEVAIDGFNFTTATAVTFNDLPANGFIIDDDTSIRAVVPNGAGSGKIKVTNPDGTVESSGIFSVTYPPVISGFTPAYGVVGEEVTITGGNFLYANQVAFNGTSATSIIIDSGSQIRAVVPSGATSGPITVGNPIDTVQSGDNFYVTLPPPSFTFNPSADSRVSSSSPASNYGSSSELRVRNAGISYNSYLKFNISGLAGAVEQATLRLYCTNDGSDGGSVYVVSNSWTESAITWNNAPLIGGTLIAGVGPVSVNTWVEIDITSAISGNGIISLGMKSNSSNSVYYSSKEGGQIPELVVQTISTSNPSISSFTPTIGSIGREITLTGSNFSSVFLVTFNGIASSFFTIDSDTELRAVVPPGATSGKIAVVNEYGMGTSQNDFLVVPAYNLTTNVSGSGGITLNPSGGVYDSSSVVTLSALPYPGYAFSGWSGDLGGSANPDSVVMDDNKAVTAVFTRQFNLSTNVSGSGVITLNPPGGVYDSLTTVTLTATPDPGYVFSGWSGDLTGNANPDSVVMDTIKSVTATFEELPPPIVNAKAFLEGPYQNGSMLTIVKDNGGLPLAQPYNISPWNYSGGENVNSIPADVVDWVLVGLRSTETTAELSYRAAFIKSDGSIVDTSGSGGVKFESVPYGDYFVVIYHRNHLAIMSSTARALSDASTLYDFSTAMTRAYGTNPMVELAPGVFGMIGGDGNSDGIVNDADKTLWRVENGTHWLYSKFGDFNIDGGIDALDLNYGLRVNSGLMTGVPGVSAAKVSGKSVEREKEMRVTPSEPRSKINARKKIPEDKKTGDNTTTSVSHSEGTE